MHCSMPMLQYHQNVKYSLSIHLFYGWFYLLTISCLMATKGLTHLHNPAAERCRFVKLVWRFGTNCHERFTKFNVHGYPLGPARNY